MVCFFFLLLHTFGLLIVHQIRIYFFSFESVMSQVKRFKHEIIALETLPNELLVEIFGYLNGVDTVYAFSKLNTRFQCLLNDYVRDFDLKSISKAKFDFIIRMHNTQQWRSLRMSNGNSTPGQIRAFCQLCPLRKHIDQIQLLTVLDMTPEYASEFLVEINSLQYLTSLSIERVCGLNIQMIDLPVLKRLCLTSCKHTDWIMVRIIDIFQKKTKRNHSFLF